MQKGEFVLVNGRMLMRVQMNYALSLEFPGGAMYMVGQSHVIVHQGGIVVRGIERAPTMDEVRAALQIFGTGRKEWQLKGRRR